MGKSRVRKLCSAAGCEEVAEAGGSQCAEHASRSRARLAERRSKAQQSDHAKSARRLYGLARWKRESRAYLKRNPLCEDCAELGAVEPSTQVDHKVRHMGDRKLFFDKSNWQALCQSCHSRKTAQEVFHGRAPGVGK